MYTQCPACRTIFEIDEEALQASLGIVHCGKCATRFDALRSLSDTLPAEPGAALGNGEAEPRVLTLTSAVTAATPAPAAPRKRRRPRPPPAPAPATPVATAAAPAAVTPDLDLSAALIADTTGTPAGGVEPPGLAGESRPVQARFAGLDLIPLSPDDLAAIEAGRPARRTERAAAAPASPADAADAPPDAGSASTAAAEVPGTTAQAPAPAPPAPVADDPTPAPDVATAVAPAPAAEPAPLPVYIRPHAPWYARRGLWWGLASLLLAVTLAAQLAWSERVALLRNPRTRAAVLQVCSQLPCRLPPVADTTQLQLVSRDVRPDPDVAGALVITATLRNTAAFRQPWPIVSVELSDIDGNPVAMRRFRPPAYLPDPARRARGIAAGATVAVAFVVADPGKRAVNFQFGFE